MKCIKRLKLILPRIFSYIKKYRLLLVIIFGIVLTYFLRNQIECILSPYPRITTILGMFLTILIAYLGFYNQTQIDNERSEKIYLNIRKKLAHTFVDEKSVSSNHKLTGLLYAINEINKCRQRIKYPIKLTNLNEIKNTYPEYYDSILAFLSYIENYKINDQLNSIIKIVNKLSTTADSINLKDKEQKKLNDFLYKIKTFQLIILSHSNHLLYTKQDELFREYHLLFAVSNIISESRNSEILLKEIIDFYSNSTEYIDL